MKKLLVFLFILVVSMGIIYSQAITVTSPRTGDTWYNGSTYTITWTKTGTMGNFVKIKLRNSTSTAVVLDIISHIPNNGSYSWLIPASVAPGNYRIRLRTTDNEVYGDSNVFSIPYVTGLVTVPEKAPVKALDTVSVKAPINAPRKLESATNPIIAAYKFEIQAIKPILVTPDKVKFQVQYYISPDYPDPCYISASITSPKDNVYMASTYCPIGGIPKGQNYFSHNATITFIYMKSTPFTSSQVKIKIYDNHSKTLTVKYINWDHTWIKQ